MPKFINPDPKPPLRQRGTARSMPVRHPAYAGRRFTGSRFNALPPAHLPGETAALVNPIETEISCSVYSDPRLLVNALIALGSFRIFSPGMRCSLFLEGAEDFGWLSGVTVIDADETLRASSVDVDVWSGIHHDAIGHYFRKVAMWLYQLDPIRAEPAEWHALIDADVLFLRPTAPLLRRASGHAFAAMIESWHQNIWRIYERQSNATKLDVDHLFHGRVTEEKMRDTPYFNAGFILARADESVRAAMKDVLAASMFYASLSRNITCAEQTLLNLALMVRDIPCRDLHGLCVPSYSDEKRGWPEPIARHFLGDQQNRIPSVLRARYPQIVDRGLAAVGVDLAELQSRGLWT